MQSSKPRVLKDFEKLDEAIQQQIKLAFPYGFEEDLIRFTDREGKRVSALPFETDDRYYLIRMTREEAKAIIEDDDDFDDDGVLKNKVKNSYEDKFSELDHMADYISGNTENEDKTTNENKEA